MSTLVSFKNRKIEYLGNDSFKFINENIMLKQESTFGKILIKDEIIDFSMASINTINTFDTIDAIGFEQVYEFNNNLILSCKTYINKSTEEFEFTLSKKSSMPFSFDEIQWPVEFKANETISSDMLSNYLVLPYQQGLILPNNWPDRVENLHFDGQFASSAAYMNWLGQVRENVSFMYIIETPWDCKYSFNHPENGPTSNIKIRWLSSLGDLSYDRKLILKLEENLDYNAMAKIYRQHMIENNNFYYLKDKAISNPKINDLLGASIVHSAIKTNIVKESRFFDNENPSANYRVVSFDQRKKEISTYKKLGADKIYLHLDGWAQPGYDNKHPDFFPACIEAGGWKGLKELQDYLQENGDLIGLHDQYRDFYFDSSSFDLDLAVQLEDGNHPQQAIWAGGRQTYMCTKVSYEFVKRNFNILFDNQIHPDCSYLDVFTCNEPDECFNPNHKISRRESLKYRSKCFEFLRERNILSSSEECIDWALKELVFCHYGPYEFMLKPPKSKRIGIGVPLFNLVYHDSVILPWIMDKNTEDHEDYMLYALLNAGMPYLIRDGAYPNTDGAFEESVKKEIYNDIKRSNLVANLQKELAFEQMISHKFIDNNPYVQETKFSNGKIVRINLKNNSYEII